MTRLGVFDSGVGGLHVVKKIKETSTVDIIFLADQKNLPYGQKTVQQLQDIMIDNIQWFIDHNINHILLACNTASTIVNFLRAQFPGVTIDSIIEITASQFDEVEDLLIFGTLLTATARGYDKFLKELPRYQPLDQLASLVEENDAKSLKQYLKHELKDAKAKNYLLGCTHYGIITHLFDNNLNGVIYDSIAPVVNYYQDFVGSSNLEIHTSSNIKVLKIQIEELFMMQDSVLPMNNSYKVVVVSDSHGHNKALEQILENHPDAAAFIHCGDLESEPSCISKYYAVSGNNDFYYDYPETLLIDIGLTRFYILHGHQYMKSNRLEKLYQAGINNQANVVCFGHEHVFQSYHLDDLVILNPGSLYYNRDGSAPCYALLQITDDKIEVIKVND